MQHSHTLFYLLHYHLTLIEHGLQQNPLYIDDQRSYEVYDYCEKEEIPIIFTFGSLTVPSLDYMKALQKILPDIDSSNSTKMYYRHFLFF